MDWNNHSENLLFYYLDEISLNLHMQSRMVKYFIYIIYLICPIILIGQETNFIKFSLIEKELSGHWISSITQDNRGFMWIGTQDGLYMYDGNSVTPYQYNPLKESLPGSYIRAMTYDKNGLFWLGVNGFGLVSFNPQNNQFKIFKDFENSNSTHNGVIIPKILVNKENTIWFQSEYGIFRKNSKELIFNKITDNSLNLAIEQTKNGKIVVAKNNKLFLYNRDKEKLVPILKNIKIDQIVSVSENKVLYKTNNKIFLFDVELNTSKQILLSEPILTMSNCVDNNCYFLGTSKIYKYNWLKGSKETYMLYNSDLETKEINILYLDKQNVLWLGAKQGLYQENKIGSIFKESISLHAREIFADSNAIFIAGRSGFSKYSKLKKTFTSIIENVHIIAGCRTVSGFWLGDAKGNIHFVDNDSNVKLSKRVQDTNINSFTGIYGVVEDANGYIWVGFMGGIHMLNVQGDILKTFDLEIDKKNVKLNTVKFIDNDGTLWVTTVGNGIYKIPEIAKIGSSSKPFEYKNYRHILGDSSSINSNTVYDILQDRNGDLWFGTDYGLNKYILESDSFQGINKDGNLFNYNIMSINADHSGLLWITTIRDGIFVYNPNENIFYNLTEEDGLISNACLVDSSIFFDDILYFGTEDGVQLINPSEFGFPKVESQPLITNFSIIGDSKKDPSVRIYNDTDVNLNYKQTDITVNFSLLDYRFPNKINYYYKLNEIHDNWKRAEQSKVNFIDLKPGDYNLLVKAAYNYQLLKEAPMSSMKIHISPVWYKSFWAYVIYTLLIATSILKLYRFNLSRQLSLVETKKTKELDELKSKMYANITHEFRTPLTVILGMTQNIKKNLKSTTSESDKNSLSMIQRNGESLLEMVNEMLDLAKIESNSMELNLIQIDVIPFVKYLSESFHSLAETKKIKLTIYSEIDTLEMDIDVNKMVSIISNLLSNAIKFTENSGKIVVHLNKIELKEDKFLVIKVQDNGIGLAEEDIAHLFDRFYQVNSTSTKQEGTGIGLSLTREFVKLMKGTISVESTLGKGSTFTVQIPITNTSTKTEEEKITVKPSIKAAASKKEPLFEENTSDLPLVLIIEDNVDVAHYLKTCLKGKYQTVHASDGIIGIEMAFENIPDIIISDVMMPGKDGFEVCATLKADERTDHIPIILLTAKVTTEDRLTGLTHGADAYLAKPFNQNELFTRLDQLILVRKKLIRKLEKNGLSSLLKEKVVNPQTKFLKQVIESIHTHLDDTNFGPTQLAKEIGLSESQTYRKLKSITDKSTALFIRSVRLQKGKELIETTDKTISEIAYQVGFNDPSWFSRAFKKEFNLAPSDIHK